jgi:hypothetical protein
MTHSLPTPAETADARATWWFLESYDGLWLEDIDHELFTSDPNRALKWPNRTYADRARTDLHHALWQKVRAATEHKWVAP